MASTYSIQPTDGVWSLELDGKSQGSFPTMQAAIDTAKARAAREGRAVRWQDREGVVHGPIKPAALGSYSPAAVRRRLGLFDKRVTSPPSPENEPTSEAGA